MIGNWAACFSEPGFSEAIGAAWAFLDKAREADPTTAELRKSRRERGIPILHAEFIRPLVGRKFIPPAPCKFESPAGQDAASSWFVLRSARKRSSAAILPTRSRFSSRGTSTR